ncbi:MAG TPA: single-stranded-DNA-specific exonuclease RecJ [Gammaproteobacteria bacterium]
MKATFTIKRRPTIAMLEFGAEANFHPVLQRVYRQRKLGGLREIAHSLEHLLDHRQLSGMARAVGLLADAVTRDRRILIVGDFDADGATSSALAMRALRAMGARQVSYLVPNRFEYGYGLTPEIVAVAAEYKPDIIVTVDNGIASLDGVAAARQHNIKVIITDHHLPGAQLPAADAIVNPNLRDDAFPSKHLAGVGVIFYVMLALRGELRERGWFAGQSLPEPNLAQYLDLVALGTVADVVPLDHNNRILVDQGLRRIRAGRCAPGIAALLAQGKRNLADCIATDLGFAVAPRLNAAGRLEDMSLGIECLLADDPDRARALAAQLDELNKQRREIEQAMQDQAIAALETLNARLEGAGLPPGLCIYDERWHQGVIGILAARIKERVHRPVIAFAMAGEGELKGSARSVPGVHIRDVLDAVATSHPGLLNKFGGHAMAAGLSLSLNNLDVFQQAFAEQVISCFEGVPGEAVIFSDGELAAHELTLDTAEALRNAGPWGQGFPEPLFDGVFRLHNKRIVGSNHLKLELQPLDAETVFDGIAFNETGDGLSDRVEQLRIAYRLDVNEYRGNRTVQLNIQYLEPV